MKTQPIKVLYVDHWTRGLHNFLLYDPLLKECGCITKLFHIGLYRYEDKLPREVKDGIECVNISYYKTQNLGKILDKEKPDVIIALNHFELFERSLFKAAHNRKIPCVYVMHGIRGEDIECYKQFYGANTGFSRRFKKIPKYFKLMQMYLYANIEADRRFFLKRDLYQMVWKYLSDPIREIFQPIVESEMQPDICLLFSNNDFELYHQVYGFEPNKLQVVGNTKLDNLFSRVSEFKNSTYRKKVYESIGLKVKDRFILEIEDCMTKMNPKSFTHEQEAEWFRYMERVVEDAGYRFVVKLHPGTDYERFKTIFSKSSQTVVVQNTDLDALIFYSHAVIGTISTALINALAYRKIILICDWLDVDMLNFKNIFVKYGCSINCSTKSVFEQCLSDLPNCEKALFQSRETAFEKLITYSDGNSCKRAVDAIIHISEHFRQQRDLSCTLKI